MNIAHLAFDEKFVPFAQDVFQEAFPGRNTWFILHKTGTRFRFLGERPAQRIVTRRFLLSRTFRDELGNFDLLVAHTMIPAFAGAVWNAPERLGILWFAWGYDYYSYIAGYLGGLFLPRTRTLWEGALDSRSLQQSDGGLYAGFKMRLRPLYGALKRLVGGEGYAQTLESIASRIDLCSVTAQDLPLIRRALPTFRAEHYQLQYFSTEDTLERGPAMQDGRDILLGNSATPENNHLEAMEILEQLPLAERRIVTPLSYGSPHYAEEICRIGSRMFGSRFVPLRNYLPVDEYLNTVSTCGTVMMNHRRQAAMGNISVALYKGAKVILREENPIYRTFQGLGASLDSMQAIEATPTLALQPMTGEQQSRNRDVVGAYLSRSRLVAALRGLAVHPALVRRLPAARAQRAA